MIFLDNNLYIVYFSFRVALTDFDHRWISIIGCVQNPKALYYLFNTISSLFKYADNKNELLKLNKSLILDTIEKTQAILGTKRILGSVASG